MIAHLTGIVIDIAPAHIVLDVGGVGYFVSVASSSGFILGEKISIHTHLAVRENALDLYGFTSRDALTMFGELIKLPKIGPKTAMQILSQADLAVLTHAARTDDPTYLSKMSGISKKSAEKIVAGLKEALDTIGSLDTESPVNHGESDVIDALMALGYSQRDAQQALQKIPQDITDTNARIKYALKHI